MLIKRYAVFIAPIVVGLFLEIGIVFPRLLYLFGAVAFVWVLLTSIVFIREKWLTKEFWYFALVPLMLLLSILGILLFVETAFTRHVFILSYMLMWMLYLENMFLYYFAPERYQAYSLANISRTYYFFATFLFVSALNGGAMLINIPIWTLGLALIGWSIFMGQQRLWISGVTGGGTLFYSIIISIIIFEAFWVLSFLPLDLYMHGFIMALIAYLLVEVVRSKLMNKQLPVLTIGWVSALIVVALAVAIIFAIK